LTKTDKLLIKNHTKIEIVQNSRNLLQNSDNSKDSSLQNEGKKTLDTTFCTVDEKIDALSTTLDSAVIIELKCLTNLTFFPPIVDKQPEKVVVT
jgi:hypothetical protein